MSFVFKHKVLREWAMCVGFLVCFGGPQLQAWECELCDGTGYCMLTGPDQSILSLWASDFTETLPYKNNTTISLWRTEDDTLIGPINNIIFQHSLRRTTVVRTSGADPGCKLAASVFNHLQGVGHIWFKTDDLYDKLYLKTILKAAYGYR